MTRAYLLSTFPSNSSIGGFVMPSGRAAVPDTQMPSWRAVDVVPGYQRARESGLPRESGLTAAHQTHEPVRGVGYRGRDDHGVELRLSRELDAALFQPSRHDVGGFGAAASQPAFELLP